MNTVLNKGQSLDLKGGILVGDCFMLFPDRIYDRFGSHDEVCLELKQCQIKTCSKETNDCLEQHNTGFLHVKM